MKTAPLNIATVEVGVAKLGICALPGSDNTLDDDLLTIAAWHPATILTMTEQQELDASGVSDIGTRLQAKGFEWHHFPVRDFDCPNADEEAAWETISSQLHALLDQGRNVLVHCRGGRGRSGMAAMRLLVERGTTPEAALAQLRSVRPYTVETKAQRVWAARA